VRLTAKRGKQGPDTDKRRTMELAKQRESALPEPGGSFLIIK
jgi:hypothetical protein